MLRVIREIRIEKKHWCWGVVGIVNNFIFAVGKLVVILQTGF